MPRDGTPDAMRELMRYTPMKHARWPLLVGQGKCAQSGHAFATCHAANSRLLALYFTAYHFHDSIHHTHRIILAGESTEHAIESRQPMRRAALRDDTTRSYEPSRQIIIASARRPRIHRDSMAASLHYCASVTKDAGAGTSRSAT